jgi:hypothetical protein
MFPEVVTVLVRVSTPEIRVLIAADLVVLTLDVLLTVLRNSAGLVLVEVLPDDLSLLDTVVDLPTTGL